MCCIFDNAIYLTNIFQTFNSKLLRLKRRLSVDNISLSLVTMEVIRNETNATSTVNIFFAIFIPCLSSFTIFGNATIMVAFWKVPILREKPGELLILNLAFVDFSTGLITLPLWSPAYITPDAWPLGEIGCRITAAFNNITVHGSLFAIMTISVDRFLLVLIQYPKYLKLQSRHRVYATIAACWIFALLTVVPQQAIWNIAKEIDLTAKDIDFSRHCLFPPRRVKIYSSTIFLSLYFVPVVLLCVLSIAFLCLLRRRLQRSRRIEGLKMQRSPAQGIQLQQASTQSSRYTKPAISLISVVSAMAICMLPYCIYVIVIELDLGETRNNSLLYALLLLQFCNACLDPIFYGMTQRKIRCFYGLCVPKNMAESVAWTFRLYAKEDHTKFQILWNMLLKDCFECSFQQYYYLWKCLYNNDNKCE